MDKATLATGEGGVRKGHTSLETVVNEILLAVGPLELEIMHCWSATRDMCGVVSGIGMAAMPKIRGRHSRAEDVGGLEGIEWGSDFLCNVEDGADASFDETFPVASVVLGAYPYAWNDLNGAILVGNGFRATVLVLAMEKGDGGVCGGK